MIPIPEELLEQFERGNVLLFVGERIVRSAEGRAFIDHVAAELAARCGIAEGGLPPFPEAAQAYEDQKGRQALVQFVRDSWEQLDDEPQRAHHLIANLTNCNVLATTCVDRRLEQAFREAGRSLDVIVGSVDLAFEDEHKARLYRLRGSLEQPESLVLTEDDYETFFEDQTAISVVLKGYLARKTILFVGYDLTDPYFKQFYRMAIAPLDKQARWAYAFGEAPPPRVCRWCDRHGVEVIPSDATVFLEALADQLAARARPVSVASLLPIPASTVPLPARPYKLLDYYEAGDEAIFYGRQEETRKLVSLIHGHRLVLFYGASGTGKTSLLLAGVAPRLARADPPYETLHVRALEDPAQTIRSALRRRLPEAGLPEAGPLVDFLHAATQALGCTLVLLLDQFEEFFIRLSPEFRQAFIAELGALYDARDVPVKAVFSLREDWLASVSEIEQRIPEMFHVKMRLLPLTREQARQAIAAPVKPLGVSYETALLEQLLNDLTGAQGTAISPPQLQLVCHALYEKVAPGERIITLACYQEQLHGARGVLQAYLDDELARLPGDEQSLARDLLAELVTSERTKAVKTSDELALALGTDAAGLEMTLGKLVRARLLRVLEQAGSKVYELAHEYLIAEIALSPEAVARKEAEELLRQSTGNWRRFAALPAAETFDRIDAQRDRLRLDAEAQELMLRAALRHGRAVGYWIGRAEKKGVALGLAEEALLSSQGDVARRSLGVEAAEAGADRLRALVERLDRAWRKEHGTVRALAADALWALRWHLPRGLRLRLALARSPRLLRRAALPLAGALVAALAFILVLWGPRLWMPRPEIEWVDVPAGEFVMGSSDADPDADSSEKPQHTVYLDAYRIGKYEVTNRQYAQCVRAKVCKEPTDTEYYDDPAYADHPVVSLRWLDTRDFCRWIGGRLPTEAEWEKAARGTDGRIYPWGDEPPDCDKANLPGCTGGTKAVGSYPEGASPYGAMSMAGNVYEWVADRHAADYYARSPERNPQGPDAGDLRVLRGGSWDRPHSDARCTARLKSYPGVSYPNDGVRCVYPISRPGS